MRENNHYNSYLQNAWNKYGENSFIFKTIEGIESQLLNIKEIEYIKSFKSNESRFGYNLATPKGSHITSKERREEKSKIMLEVWKDPTQKAKRSEAMKEVWLRSEYIEKQKRVQAEVWKNPKQKAKRSNATKETWQNPISKQNRIKGLKRALNTDDYRENRSKVTKNLWKDPNYRKKTICAMKKAWDVGDRRKKRSEQYQGIKNPFYNKTHTKETMDRIKKALTKITCEEVKLFMTNDPILKLKDIAQHFDCSYSTINRRVKELESQK